ncbi:MAG: hypothetical protein CO120_01760 [Gammaproteobacteria bacterium CG_4_9_14_3_um_filter_38_9]|nr:MAG: hypothetical protein CO120_01760 [Gammaproteobacteria bacterium CG_4_9_14_3_um_filter_38_9]
MGGLARCWILDGLQRTTALGAFIDGKLPVFGDYYFSELVESNVLSHSCTLNIEVFKFADHVEAAEFYIKLNKGITHSDADIKRAEDFIKSQEGVISA